MLTHLSLFTGIGGLDLAAEWAGFKTVGQCEWADYPTKVLEKHWPDVPRWRDIHDLSARDFISRTSIRPGELTVISGGFPCQPFSVAGNQKGKEDARYLWPQMLRVISELHSAYIIGENVPGILKIAADDVCKDLEREGYEVGIFNYEAAAVGALHRRERFFFVGHDKRRGQYRKSRRESEQEPPNGYIKLENGIMENTDCSGCGQSKVLCEQPWGTEPLGTGQIMAEPKGIGLQGLRETGKQITNTRCKERKPERSGFSSDTDKKQCERSGDTRRWRPESSNGSWWSVESGMGGVVNGLPSWVAGYWLTEPDIPRVAAGVKDRVNKLKCFGNAVVPYQAYPIFRAIADIELML